MSPDELLRALDQRGPAPAYLFIGPETWSRERCREALISKALLTEDRADGYTRHDLDETELSTVIDDARSFSLFARNRVIWVGSAEAALPRGRSAAADDEEGAKEDASQHLSAYLKDPVPGVVLVFDCSRYEFDGDDKTKLQRVQKFYSCVPVQVEFMPFTPAAAHRLARDIAREYKLRIGESELDSLVDALGSDAARIGSELEKLALFAGTERPVTEDDIQKLVPSARASTIFALVNALARNDRVGALESLDVLVREGEYLPLALSYLSTQFRLGLAAREAKLTGVNQVQAFFSRQGTPMWRSRAEQVAQTAGAFSAGQLRAAVRRIYETDKALRDTRPDDRTVMEQLVFELTAA